MKNAIKTAHNLDFEVANSDFYGQLFRVGTCNGMWRVVKNSYVITAVMNNEPHNGHLDDVFEWFEYAAKRDSMNLCVEAILSKRFYNHLIEKRGFVAVNDEAVIKIFNNDELI